MGCAADGPGSQQPSSDNLKHLFRLSPFSPICDGSFCDGGPRCLLQNLSCDEQRRSTWGTPPSMQQHISRPSSCRQLQLLHGKFLLV